VSTDSSAVVVGHDMELQRWHMLWTLLGEETCAACDGPLDVQPRRGTSGPVCTTCRMSVTVEPIVLQPQRGLPQVIGGGPYAGALQRMIIGWKERGRADIGPVLIDRLRAALSTLGGGATVVVPIPARRGAVRARGSDVILDAARGLSTNTTSVAPVLHHRARSRDQAGLSASERETNVNFTMSVGIARPVLVAMERGHQIVILDDVFTTGSTAREAVRALSVAGVAASAVITMAVAGRQHAAMDLMPDACTARLAMVAQARNRV
jgi:predicted amidophosphoribosyltransferase